MWAGGILGFGWEGVIFVSSKVRETSAMSMLESGLWIICFNEIYILMQTNPK